MANVPSQELAQDKNPHGEPPAPELKGKHLSHATGAQPATQPAEPHSDSTGEELWREKEKLALAWLNFMAHRSSISMNKSDAIWNGTRRIMFRFSNQ